jgi:hypothetical protein
VFQDSRSDRPIVTRIDLIAFHTNPFRTAALHFLEE